MVHAQAFDLVKRQKRACQEQLVLFLQGERKTIDDGSQNLKQLCYAIEALRLVYELEKDIVDGSSNI